MTSFLLYSNGTEILGIPLDPQDRKTEALAPISKIQFAVAIDFYVSDSSKFFFSESLILISDPKKRKMHLKTDGIIVLFNFTIYHLK